MSEIDWSKAPEGATHYHPDAQIVVWYRKRAGNWECYSPEGYWGPSVASPKDLRDLIPRPTQWRGPEDGLPPVGTVCEVKPVQGAGWCSGKVVHVTAKGVALYEDRWGDFGHSMAPADFRPLKSDKERAVEAAMGKIDKITTMEWKCRRQFLEQCYDAGLLRLPEEQS